jgi:hypothetical protein
VYDFRFPWVRKSALFGRIVFRSAYHDCCIQQDMPHGRHILQHHSNAKRSNDLQRGVKIAVLRQRNQILKKVYQQWCHSRLQEDLVFTLS